MDVSSLYWSERHTRTHTQSRVCSPRPYENRPSLCVCAVRWPLRHRVSLQTGSISASGSGAYHRVLRRKEIRFGGCIRSRRALTPDPTRASACGGQRPCVNKAPVKRPCTSTRSLPPVPIRAEHKASHAPQLYGSRLALGQHSYTVNTCMLVEDRYPARRLTQTCARSTGARALEKGARL